MSLILEVPDAVASGLRLPEAEVLDRLRLELAIALYSQGILSFGKALDLARMDRITFGQVLTKRGIARHYTRDELNDDLAYAHDGQ